MATMTTTVAVGIVDGTWMHGQVEGQAHGPEINGSEKERTTVDAMAGQM